VLRAHDPDLERPLAVKVLLGKHQGNAPLERRFLEEARLTGQLQHPAIPPVHEVGRLDDGRPFFAMKLIKGHTLARLLERRQGPGEELPRWLGVFTAVCQGVAYAHSKGVIHRDLKPANVMVGAFGEVQVMDWGLAKVLGAGECAEETAEASRLTTGRTEEVQPWSQVGDVLGTYAYMAPEQARGAVDELDPRSDVFGLGAMLCVILTGEPPYRGSNGRQLHGQAQRAELSEALGRLDGCGADREVVALARCCLAPAREDRPADAGEVARALVAYQAGVQERLRQAELERAAAQVKAAEERKRRRLLVGLGAVVTLVLVLGTAAAVYWQQQRQRAREQAEAGLAQATELRRDYRFKDAEAMLKQASGWARQAADRQLQQRVAQVEADLALARELDWVRQEAAALVEGKWDPGRVRRLYPEVLAGHGLDVLEGDLDELAQTIRASTVRQSIVAALDDWAAHETNPERWQRLLKLANLADDPDPWRQAVRQALVQRDGRRLRQLVSGTGEGKPTPGAVLLLAGAFRLESNEPTALLRRMQLEQPRDFWVSLALGNRLGEQKKYQEEAECYLVAVALRPDSAPAHNNLGNALSDKGKVDEAIACYHNAIAIDPKFAGAHTNLGVALYDKRKLDQAIACYHKAIAIDPKLPQAHTNLGNALRHKGQVDEAIDCHRKAIALDPRYASAHTNLGNALGDKGKLDEAIDCHRKAIALDPKYAAAHNNLGNALLAKGKADEAIDRYRKAIKIDPKLAQAHNNLGNALKDKGKVDEAIDCYHQAIACDPKYASAHYNLGVALYGKGQVDQAIACYHQAIACDPKYASAHTTLGLALSDKGKLDEAISEYRQAIAFDPKNAKAHNNLGLAWKSKGKLDEAIACWRKAIACDPKYATAHFNLGVALRDKGKLDEAIACWRKAIACDPNYATAHAGLGEALMQQGHFIEAQKSLRRCLELLPDNHPLRGPVLRLRRQCRQYLEVDGKLKAFLAGKEVHADAATQVQMASLAQQPFNQLYLTAAQLYRDAFDHQASLAKVHRYNAACAAALAGCGQGQDAPPGDEARARLRRRALRWLRADLAAWRRLRDKGPAAGEKQLRHWRQDPDLSGVRDKGLLARLPAQERLAWHKLWADVADALAAAQK
jgi:tetratricopeptide (TPR) repeat protein